MAMGEEELSFKVGDSNNPKKQVEQTRFDVVCWMR
jgi:hypothetical protein